MHSTVIMVESMSLTSRRLRRPGAGTTRDVDGRVAQRRLDARADRSAVAGVDRQLAGFVRRRASAPCAPSARSQGGYRGARRSGARAGSAIRHTTCAMARTVLEAALAMQAAVP